MRAELIEWVQDGHPLSEWSERVGFLMGDGMRPTRTQVAPFVNRTPTRGWHVLALPSTDTRSVMHNEAILRALGLFDAEVEDFGRLRFRVLRLLPVSAVSDMVSSWAMPERSGWSRTDIRGFLQRVAATQPTLTLDVALLESPDGAPRRRGWRGQIGFSNLMQGRDNNYSGRSDEYPGDRAMFGSASGLQVHWVVGREGHPGPLHTLAIHIGDEVLAATEVRRS